MRRPSTVELMLLTTILLWALNLSVTKYILTHGLLPLSYATVRYALAGLIFVGLTLYVERTLRVERRHLPVLALAALVLWLNQLSFVLALDATTASTIGLVLGAIPIFAALFGLALGTERASGRFWIAALVSFSGVALVAAGTGGEFSSDFRGILLGLSTAATWAAYSVIVAPLMRTYSPSRMSAVVIPAAWVAIALSAIPQTSEQDWDVGWWIWVLLVLATARPARAHEHPLVSIGAPDRRESRDARGQPAAVRRGRARGGAPLRADQPAPDRRWRPDRARHSRRPPTRARSAGATTLSTIRWP